MLILGIDDAGRGPVIGPMVLAGCLVDEKTEKEFKRLGVKDSKQLTQKRREFLDRIIKEKAETFETVMVSANEIDSMIKDGTNLNEIEAFLCGRIINKINKGFDKIKVVVDCPSTGIVKWQDMLKTKIDNLSNLEISCEHKADKNHIAVSAASILAKTVREKEVSKLKEIYGNDMGSGYASDPITTKFLRKNIKKLDNSGLFRKSWATWKNAVAVGEQKKLRDF